MSSKRVLLMHISPVSGHRSASLAIAKALQEKDKHIQTLCIDAFNYINPQLEKLVNKSYMFVIQTIPRFWDYLYDNKDVFGKITKIRSAIHKQSDKKIKKLMGWFKPDIVVCTQAFPCGVVADYKRRHNLNIPLVGVLTDYAPHSYWLSDSVDTYVVPALKIQQIFIEKGIASERLKTIGIPIDSKFNQKQSNRQEIFRRLGLDATLPTILVMGGGQGLGPIKDIIRALDKLNRPAQLIIVCGVNKGLYKWLNKNKSLFTKPLSILGYAEEINDLMSVSSFIVSKPGGLTSAEALSKSLPIIIVKPLPGQESQNTQFLLEAGAALKVEGLNHLRPLAQDLLSNPVKLHQLRSKAQALACKDSALKIAQVILNTMNS